MKVESASTLYNLLGTSSQLQENGAKVSNSFPNLPGNDTVRQPGGIQYGKEGQYSPADKEKISPYSGKITIGSSLRERVLQNA